MSGKTKAILIETALEVSFLGVAIVAAITAREQWQACMWYASIVICSMKVALSLLTYQQSKDV